MSGSDRYVDDEINLSAVVAPLVARWKFVLFAFLVSGALGYGLAKVLPKTYRSSAAIFVQQKSSSSSLLQDLPVALTGSSNRTSSYLVALLRSETLMRGIAERLDLRHNPEYAELDKRPDGLITALGKNVSVTDDKNGTVTVSVTSRSPYLAAKIANSMVDALDTLVIRSSKRKAEFIEQRMSETSRELRAAEDKLLKFSKAHDIAAIEEQTKGIIERMAEVEGELFSLDVKLQEVDSQLKTAGGLKDLVDLSVQKQALEASRNYAIERRTQMQDELRQIPSVAAEYARMQRTVNILNKTYGLLSEQYQLARITQQGEDGDYQIIDRATPKKRPVAPRASMTTSVCGILGVLAASAAILSRDQKRQRRARGTRPSRTAPPSEPRAAVAPAAKDRAS